MGSKRAAPKGKMIKPTFWVFCEGETEAAYIAMLRSQYRIPIEIITKVAGNSIAGKYINKCKQGRFTHKKAILPKSRWIFNLRSNITLSALFLFA